MRTYSFTSDTLKKSDGLQVAIKYRNKVYIAKDNQIHAQVIDYYNLPYNKVITGYVDKKNHFIYQYL